MAREFITQPRSLAQGAGVASHRPNVLKAGLGLHLSERRFLLALVDILVLSGALFLALWVRSSVFAEMEPVWYFPVRPIWWLTLAAIWFPLALVFDCYDLKVAADPAKSAVYAAGCTLIMAVIYMVIPIISAPLTRSRLAWFLFATLAMAAISVHRVTFARMSREESLARRVVIVGAGAAGCSLAGEVRQIGAWSGIQLLGFVDDDTRLAGSSVMDIPVLGSSHDLVRLVRERRVQDVVLAITNTDAICESLMQALITCWSEGATVVPMAVYYEDVTGAVPAQHLGQNLFTLAGRSTNIGLRLWDLVRRLSDVAIGIVGLSLTAIVAPFIALAITIDGPGSIFYRQERVGLGGRRFILAKFRSMVPDAEANGAVWACANDCRITRVGTFLRRTRLDELPQFWNLVNGTMSLIGPRPERPVFVEQLTEAFPYYPVRHSVRPGLTGWAQVRFRYGSSVDDALNKLRYDLYYLKHRGPVLDAVVCLYTLRVMLRMEGS